METGVGREFFPEGNGPNQHISSQTGNTKPLHRFLRGEPKCFGIVMLFLGACLFLFAIPTREEEGSLAYAPYWIGTMYCICGILYILAERSITKKIVTASLAFSVISILGTCVSVIIFIRSLVIRNTYRYHYHYDDDFANVSSNSGNSLEGVFLFHSLIALVILITMSVFSRLALRSTHTQMVMVMRYPPSTE